MKPDDKYAPDVERLLDLVDAVDKGKPATKDIRAIRLALQDTLDLWRVLGDMNRNAADDLINQTKAPNSVKYSMAQGWESIQAELGAADATPLERLLIQQVALAWLRLGLVEFSYTAVTNEGGTFRKMDYWERRLNAAQRRFLRASETLARVSRIALPAVQVNVAQQQVNQLNTG